MSRNSPISMAFRKLLRRLLRPTKSDPSQLSSVTSADHQLPPELKSNTLYNGSSNKTGPTGVGASSYTMERSATSEGGPGGALETPQPQAGSPSPKRSTDGPDRSKDGNAPPHLMSAMEAISSPN